MSITKVCPICKAVYQTSPFTEELHICKPKFSVCLEDCYDYYQKHPEEMKTYYIYDAESAAEKFVREILDYSADIIYNPVHVFVFGEKKKYRIVVSGEADIVFFSKIKEEMDYNGS